MNCQESITNKRFADKNLKKIEELYLDKMLNIYFRLNTIMNITKQFITFSKI